LPPRAQLGDLPSEMAVLPQLIDDTRTAALDLMDTIEVDHDQ
jgi:hypothetical protein